MGNDELDLVLSKLDGKSQHGWYWMARCPAHEDRHASLSIKRGDKHPVALLCHAGCETVDILAAIDLTFADVSMPRDRELVDGRFVNVYDYTDEHGELLFQVCRTPDKKFLQRHPGPTGEWIWRTGNVRKVPYRLPKIIEAVTAGEPVYIVEGEKDVQSIERAGAVATSSPGGAGKWLDEYDEHFKNADVLIVADRDAPGREHAQDILAHLRPLARSVAIFEAADGKDVTDHLAAGHTLAELVPYFGASRALAVVELEPATEFIPPPTLICSDLLYLGAVHTLSGPPDCGKTTLACWWMLQAVRDGGSVLFLDEEGGRAVVIEKFQSLGAQPGERIGYVEFPSRKWNEADVAVLNEVLAERQPTIVAWDSSAAFLSRAGLDENAAADVTRFYSHVLIPAARQHNAAVVVIDHDTKNGEPSRYARGSGAKLAATDVAYKIAPVRPFSRTENGTSKLLVSKDRRGWLHRAHEAAFLTNTETVTVNITAMAVDSEHPELTPAEQKILETLDDEPRSIPDIVQRIADSHGHGLRRETVSRGLNKLLTLGLADKIDTGQSHHLWTATNAI